MKHFLNSISVSLALLSQHTLAADANNPRGQSLDDLVPSSASIQRIVTVSILDRLRFALSAYATDKGKFPEGDLNKVISALGPHYFFLADGFDGTNKPNHPVFMDSKGSLIDGWSVPFVLKRNTDNSKIMIVSCGSNRRAEETAEDGLQRGEDDIYFVLDLKKL